MKKIYAVKNGRNTGIFYTWEQCEEQIKGYPLAQFKSFHSVMEAQAYLDEKLEEMDEIMEEMPYLYVDGSYNAGTKRYGYGGYLCYLDKNKQEKRVLVQGSDTDENMAKMRNVAGEILGAQAGIQLALSLGLTQLTIYYDYAGIEKWANGSWKRNKEGTKAYYAFVQKAKKDIHLQFQHVKAHSGIEGNEIADKMAKEAVGLI